MRINPKVEPSVFGSWIRIQSKTLKITKPFRRVNVCYPMFSTYWVREWHAVTAEWGDIKLAIICRFPIFAFLSAACGQTFANIHNPAVGTVMPEETSRNRLTHWQSWQTDQQTARQRRTATDGELQMNDTGEHGRMERKQKSIMNCWFFLFTHVTAQLLRMSNSCLQETWRTVFKRESN